MSNYAMTMAWGVKGLTPRAKLVLLSLADQANDDMECWPGRKSLSKRCDCNERTITRIIGDLISQGLLEVEQRMRPDGSQTSNVYRLIFPSDECTVCQGGVSQVSRGGGHTCLGGVDTGVHPRTHIEPKENNIAKKKFTPPLLSDVEAYIEENGYNVDPSKWYDFYESKGWMVGANKMVNWKAAVRTWVRKTAGSHTKRAEAEPEIDRHPTQEELDMIFGPGWTPEHGVPGYIPEDDK